MSVVWHDGDGTYGVVQYAMGDRPGVWGCTARATGSFEFAFDAAARRGVSVRAVHGRSLPAQAYAPWGIDPDMAEELAADARKTLGDALRPWRAKFPAVDVTEPVHLESPARVLVQAAAGAALLVTGRRQKRSALAPPIGPVLQAALHHAPCPVAVVAHE
ncbi:universal stress protein [Streptomyces olivoreticuli]